MCYKCNNGFEKCFFDCGNNVNGYCDYKNLHISPSCEGICSCNNEEKYLNNYHIRFYTYKDDDIIEVSETVGKHFFDNFNVEYYSEKETKTIATNLYKRAVDIFNDEVNIVKLEQNKHWRYDFEMQFPNGTTILASVIDYVASLNSIDDYNYDYFSFDIENGVYCSYCGNGGCFHCEPHRYI